jgi:hypothetical protein
MHGDTRLNAILPFGDLFNPGQFGRLFPNLWPLNASDDALTALGNSMIEPPGSKDDPALDNPAGVPAGYTYLGQFIDHDITFDTTTLPEIRVDPLAIHNFRTPKLDLDSLYGTGPGTQPYIYERTASSAGPRFLIGSTQGTPDVSATFPNDLARNDQKFALIGDPRNDENLIVAQTHLAFLKFHNKIIDTLGVDFDEARRIVTWHYQWIVLHDFLPRVLDPAVLSDVIDHGRDFYLFALDAYIPVEFAIAGYRLGHSMVREDYDYNRVFGDPAHSGPGHITDATLNLLFQFTGFSSGGTRMPVPSNWIIDWRRFYDLPRPAGIPLNISRRLDPFLTPQMHKLGPPPGFSLAVRNLIRGSRNGLPSGQAVAATLHLPALTPAEIATGSDGAVAAAQNLLEATPLWYYILKEADVKGGGAHLGPVGSRLVAEVFVGLLEGDARSFLSQAPEWKPTLPGANFGHFTMADLLTFVGEINPIG